MRLLSVLLLALLGPACSPPAEEPETRVREPHVLAEAVVRGERVVSLSLAASRLLGALGAQPSLVGVDRASSRLSGLEGLPVTDLHDAGVLAPDIVLVDAGRDQAAIEEMRALGIDVIEVAPHDLEEAFELSRRLGERLLGPARALAFESALSRELAVIAGASFGGYRPRVLALRGVDPIVAAGGHSFATDLVEIAGGTSVTHGGAETDLVLSIDELGALGAEVILVISDQERPAAERDAIRGALPDDVRVEFFAFDARRDWMDGSVEAARRLRRILTAGS